MVWWEAWYNNIRVLNTYTCMHAALSNTVGRFKTSQYRPTSARISWKESEKIVTGYTVQVEGPDSTQVIPNIINTYIEISDLRPTTLYFFKVSAVTVAGTTPQRGNTLMPYDHYRYTCMHNSTGIN